MELHSDYYLSQPSEQLKPQQLARNIFFGPLNVLSRQNFLLEKDIRFFICIGIPTQRLANLTNNDDGVVMVNFDTEFSGNMSREVACYQEHNSSLLRKIIDKILVESTLPAPPSVVDSRCLTPQPENCELGRSFIDTLHTIYQTGNIVAHFTGLQRFKIFNDLLTAFQLVNPNAGTFIFSQNGNDEELTSLLMSHILVKHPFIKINEAFSFVKSLRPTINAITDEQLFWLNGLVDFYESIKKNNNGYEESPQKQKFRRRIDSMDESEYMGNSMGSADPTLAQYKRMRADD